MNLSPEQTSIATERLAEHNTSTGGNLTVDEFVLEVGMRQIRSWQQELATRKGLAMVDAVLSLPEETRLAATAQIESLIQQVAK